ncbi:MAG TPA: hypothetical protein VFL47_06500, partial [Flavisolibacter sp.]|nr:hypothetical protein [Flavisolibacter sp.]
TYITTSIQSIFDGLQAGDFYLHQYEGIIDKRTNSSFHKWEKFLSTTPLAYNGKTVSFNTNLKMFNAGVVGLNSRQKDVLEDVLALTDVVYAKFQKHIAEQFAFSYCLQKAGTIHFAEDKIAHYWNLKEFRQLLKKFFAVNAEESVPNLIKKLHRIDAMAIQVEKNSYKSLPFFQKFMRNLKGKTWKIETYEKRL